MALKKYNPTTSSQRGLILVDKSALWKGKPVKALTEGKRKTGGRNNKGHVTSRGIAGGHKQRYRYIDFKRRKWDMPATVERLEYDPNRTAFIALVKYEDGELAYIIAPQRLAPGDTDRRRPQGRREAGQCDGAGPDAGRHHRPQCRDEAGQGRPDRPLGRHLRPGRRPRPRHGDGQAQFGRAALHPLGLHGHGRRGLQPGQPEPEFRQGRPQPLDGPASADPRRRQEPGRPPAWRRRRPHLGRPSSGHAVGQADQGRPHPHTTRRRTR